MPNYYAVEVTLVDNTVFFADLVARGTPVVRDKDLAEFTKDDIELNGYELADGIITPIISARVVPVNITVKEE